MNSDGIISTTEFLREYKNQKIPLCIDVRERDEYLKSHLDNTHNIPFSELTAQRVTDLVKKTTAENPTTIYILCALGIRSRKAYELLKNQLPYTFASVDGGINAIPDDLLKT